MKIASFNIENLYHRDKGLVQPKLNKCIADWVSELDSLMHRIQKNVNDMDRIRELTFLLGFEKTDPGPYGVLRKKQGELFLKPKGSSNEPKASQLTDWNGWVALQTVAVPHNAILNKARLIAGTDADVLVLQEVEDRASLMDFNHGLLREFDVEPYDQVLHLEGNDGHGRGMAIMAKNGYRLDTLKSHGLELTDGQEPIFEVDCQEYAIIAPEGQRVHILSTQFSLDKETRRKLQATKVADIYHRMKGSGKELVLVCGTLNDVSYSDCLSPILRETDLSDVTRNSQCKVQSDLGKGAGYFRLGAYRMGVNIRQKDYMLLSPELKAKLTSCGLDRKGMWPDGHSRWETYPGLKNRTHAASAHPLIWGGFKNI
ncbi:endonuclease/exonuclease/phosphatase family protein [Arenibacter sp. S6351L]|uniref:endonuclease/exonuclease/phosphatase family protein n=1 Tax=Arenibacter sp. S6351L TaxID=2926407 RepID=UPI001FF69571|nr:endonuclease/exonuclease/phosphatase family protein [Arenibacter sp. S6351L]MCK0135303.1 endonuclease/exonuclease/phosphatase family protein [Arenibacter sp. S6351L]